jgi:ubiquinone/menaquinone biosynthesis C-methylase UbiE
VAGSDVVIEAFTDLAPRYENAMHQELQELWGLSYRDFIHRLVGIVPVGGGEVILDVATGTARIPITMANQVAPGRAAIGLDITPAMLQQGLANIAASGLNEGVSLVCASALNMPFAAGIFDVAVCGLAMHHMEGPRVLPEIRRVLKDGGRLIMACVGAPSVWRSFVGSALLRIGTLWYSRTHGGARAQAEADAVPNLRTAEEWQKMLSDLGFGALELVASLAARRPWYPDALVIRAIKGAL